MRSDKTLPDHGVTISVVTSYIDPRPGGPLSVTIEVDGEEWATGTVPVSVPVLFTANDCLDIGVSLGGCVSLDYLDRAPFSYSGTIDDVHVVYAS